MTRSPTIAYYLFPRTNTSFREIGRQHIKALRDLGATIDVVETLEDAISPSHAPVAIVHPMFSWAAWARVPFDAMMARLRSRHRQIIALDVADSSSVTPGFATWANHPDLAALLVPSTFSRDSYVNSGVTTPVIVLPHGVRVSPPSGAFDSLRSDPRTKVLGFLLHSAFRKGWDLFRILASQQPSVLFVVKRSSYALHEPECIAPVGSNVLFVDDWLCESDLAALYSSCDCLLSLHRGGAFELNCLEALCYGLPVVATGHGAVLDYLDGATAYLVPPSDFPPLCPPGSRDTGVGATADLSVAQGRLAAVLADLPRAKSEARTAGRRLAALYTWPRVARQLLDVALGGRFWQAEC